MKLRLVFMGIAIFSLIWVAAPGVHGEEVSFRSGGIGRDAREEAITGYPLKLIFATLKGAYMAKVRVKITDANTGIEVLTALSQGPWFYVKVPDGFYNITAISASGVARVQRGIRVASGRTNVVMFHWPEEEVQMEVEPKLDVQ